MVNSSEVIRQKTTPPSEIRGVFYIKVVRLTRQAFPWSEIRNCSIWIFRSSKKGIGRSNVFVCVLFLFCGYISIIFIATVFGCCSVSVLLKLSSGRVFAGVGPGCTDKTLLSAIASALHTSVAPITGQLSAAVEKNPGVWLNTAQPLCKAFIVTDEDIRWVSGQSMRKMSECFV